MTVYILKECWAYEGCEVIGVYSTNELAEQQRDLQVHKYVSEYYEIEEHELDEKRNDSTKLNFRANW